MQSVLSRRVAFMVLLVVVAVASTVVAEEVTLYQVTFPERKSVDLDFASTPRAPRGELTAVVKYREGQAEIDLRFEAMKPAVLFGGDVTSYVLWAVARDGTIENLGELWVRKGTDKVSYSTGLKAFALLVTAEAYPLVGRPSELVVFVQTDTDAKNVKTEPFTFSAFVPAPPTERTSIAAVAWNESERLDVKQAEKAFELAEREGAPSYTPQIYRDARITLAQARNFSTYSSKDKGAVDYSRRTVALASEAIQIITRRKEAEALAKEIARRKAEMAALDERARTAEQMASDAQQAAAYAQQTAADAQQQLVAAQAALTQAELQKEAADGAVRQAQTELERLKMERAALEQERQQALAERDQLQAERGALLEEKTRLEQEQASLVAEQAELRASVEEMSARADRLRQEREELSTRLKGALSQVADTHATARGMIVNLPDILFAVNEAELKTQARVVLAKLSGILLIMPELNLRVEGHTDATGSDEYNQRLSERRAASVRDYLAGQGVDMNRMVAVGYGETRPVDDNETAAGRKKNRRVEIVIAQGEVAEAAAP